MASEEEDADAGVPLQNPRGLYRHFQRTESSSGAETGHLSPSHQSPGFQHLPVCGALHSGHHLR